MKGKKRIILAADAAFTCAFLLLAWKLGVRHVKIYTALSIATFACVVAESFVSWRMAAILAVASSIVMGMGTMSLWRLESASELHISGDRYVLSVKKKSPVKDVKELDGKSIRIESAKASKYLKKRISFKKTKSRNAPVLSKNVPSGYRALWTIYIR